MIRFLRKDSGRRIPAATWAPEGRRSAQAWFDQRSLPRAAYGLGGVAGGLLSSTTSPNLMVVSALNCL